MKRISYTIVAIFLLGIIIQLSLQANPIHLDNKYSRLLLDREKFTLIDIQDKISKTSYVIEPGGALFCVAFNKDASKFYETSVTYTVDGSGARKRWLKIIDSASSKMLELHFDSCPIGVSGGSVDVVVTIAAIANNPTFKWGLRLSNHSGFALGDCLFPTIQGLASKAAGSDTKDYTVLPVYSGTRLEKPRSEGICEQGYIEYPGAGCQVQMLCYCDGLGRNSLYFAADDASFFRKTFIVRPMPSKKSFSWHVQHYADGASTNGQWKLPYTIDFGPISGDWYDAAKIYRRMLLAQGRLKPISKRTDIPEWFKDINVWYQGQDRNLEEQNMTKHVERLLKIRETLGEPFAFHWYLWQKGRTHDRWYGDYFPASPGFKESVAKLRDAGVLAMPYINVELFDSNMPMWKDENVEKYASRNAKGDLNRVTWTDAEAQNVNICPSTNYWQDKMVSTIKTLVQDYGCDAVYLDELHVFPYIDYSKNLGHSDIGGNYFIESYRKILDRAKKECGKPDLILTSEHSSEIYADQISAQLTWYDLMPDSLPMFQSVMKEYTIEFGMMMFLDEIYNMDSFAGKIGFSLARGRQLGWINFDQSDFLDPALSSQMSFLRSSSKCRRAGKDFLLFGECLRPPVVTSAGNHKCAWWHGSKDNLDIPNIMAGAYRAENGDIGIILVNVTSSSQTANIPINEKDWGVRIAQDYNRSIWQNDSWSNTDVVKLDKTLTVTVPAYSSTIIRLSGSSNKNIN